MSKAKLLTCEYCGKPGYKSEASLHQHQTHTDACFAKLSSSLGSQPHLKGSKTCYTGAASHLPFASMNPHYRPSFLNNPPQKAQKLRKLWSIAGDNTRPPSFGQPLQYQDYDNDFDILLGDDSSEGDTLESTVVQVDNSMRQNFLDYVKRSKEFIPFTHQDIKAITLLIQCRKTRASLGTYEAMYRWHLESNGNIRPWESLKTSPHFLAKEKVYKMLSEHYNRDKGYGNVTKIVLPSTKAEAKIVWNESSMVIQLLLVDPCATPENYLWFDEDPFAPPQRN